jgi:sigma-B regulation protein RsbU (phosphoserine phosphatase)
MKADRGTGELLADKNSPQHKKHLLKKSLQIKSDAYIHNQKSLLLKETLKKVNLSRENLKAEIIKRKRIEEKLREAYILIKNDLEAAAETQKRLLPNPVSISGYSFNWLYKPSRYIGGDTFNYFMLDEKCLGIYLLDVSGHGVPSALLSFTISKTLLPFPEESSLLKRLNPSKGIYETLQPSHVAKELNKRFQQEKGAGEFFTMIYATLDTETGKVRLIRAGHEMPIYLPKNGKPVILEKGGLPIGVIPNIEYKNEEEFVMGKGDRFFIFTDGITECGRYSNGVKEFFSVERFLKVIEETRELSLDDFSISLEETLLCWRGNSEFDDDITMLAIERAL